MKKLTTREFIERSEIKHNFKYDYSKSIYKSSLEKVCIICPIHKEFWQVAFSHMNGDGCPKCGNIKKSEFHTMTTTKFIEKANKVHNNKYDYSLVNYTKSIEKVKIICPEHGVFNKEATQHLMGFGCQKCSFIGVANKLKSNTEEFIEKAIKIHGNLYDYSKVDYQGCEKRVEIICSKHGSFWQDPSKHLEECGCPKCNKKIRSTEEFIEQFNIVHNDKYQYPVQEINGSNSQVMIRCEIHGEFEQKAGYHLIGGGCKKCADNFNNYRKSDWIERAKDKQGIFYIIEMTENGQIFYKIGITFNSVKSRYATKYRLPYENKILKEIKSNDLNYIWELEKYCKKELTKIKLNYMPIILFPGCISECFTNIGEIERTIKEYGEIYNRL